MTWLLAIFLAVPLIEVYLFIEVGARVGILPTLGLCVFTAFVGAFLVRAQGFGLLARVQSELGRGAMPAGAFAEGAMVAVAGVLLITPGFFTDACGFLLLVPFVRRALIAHFGRRFQVVRTQAGSGPDGAIIEGEAREVKTDDVKTGEEGSADPTSPWRR